MKVVPIGGYALEKGIRLFNEGKYFDAHEVWEGPWFRAQNSGKTFSPGAYHGCWRISSRAEAGVEWTLIPLCN
jgi:predicted metal-dependent hydrolase